MVIGVHYGRGSWEAFSMERMFCKVKTLLVNGMIAPKLACVLG